MQERYFNSISTMKLCTHDNSPCVFTVQHLELIFFFCWGKMSDVCIDGKCWQICILQKNILCNFPVSLSWMAALICTSLLFWYNAWSFISHLQKTVSKCSWSIKKFWMVLWHYAIRDVLICWQIESLLPSWLATFYEGYSCQASRQIEGMGCCGWRIISFGSGVEQCCISNKW